LHRSLELSDIDNLFNDEPGQRQHRRHRCDWYSMPAHREMTHDAHVLRDELLVATKYRAAQAAILVKKAAHPENIT